LENSDLKGAQFYEANINDAYFNDAKIDAQAKRSIIRAYQWELAHFDEKVKNELIGTYAR
jgi:uncharacterized protein YjbI with pentapeptide repeats